eukprot:411482-Pleurochrysis_carterae.AAC.3
MGARVQQSGPRIDCPSQLLEGLRSFSFPSSAYSVVAIGPVVLGCDTFFSPSLLRLVWLDRDLAHNTRVFIMMTSNPSPSHHQLSSSLLPLFFVSLSRFLWAPAPSKSDFKRHLVRRAIVHASGHTSARSDDR